MMNRWMTKSRYFCSWLHPELFGELIELTMRLLGDVRVAFRGLTAKLSGRPSMSSTPSFPCLAKAWRGFPNRPNLCPGPEVGAVVVFGLTADRNSLTDFPILWTCQWIADCSDCAGAQAMDADRVIESNAKLSNTRTWAGGIWRKDTISARGDNV